MKHPRSPSKKYLIIWETVKRIPRGKVSTYGAIADESGLFGQARLVGYALHNLPAHSDVPWHRVINAQGTISFAKNSDAYTLQKRLLKSEGIVFTAGKTSLVRYGWKCEGVSSSQRATSWRKRKRR